jgi:hypothetical protein
MDWLTIVFTAGIVDYTLESLSFSGIGLGAGKDKVGQRRIMTMSGGSDMQTVFRGREETW